MGDPPRDDRIVTEGDEERNVDPLLDPEGTRAGLLPYSPHVKLPKLSLKKFNGDLTRWTTFWDTFESAVHQNPALTNIDKFSYLNSLLESTASEAVAGLTLTSANYDEAVATLKRRFGNKQSIVNRHMELLLHLEAVTSTYNLKGLRQLFDAVESNVRGLKALGVCASSYGGLLSPILMSRLPSELRLIISRELTEDEWDIEVVMEILQREIEARERSAGATSPLAKKPTSQRPPPTALSLTTGASPTQAACVYCEQAHPTSTCPVVRDPGERKQILRTGGCCFVCLRRNHLSRNCRSSGSCNTCHRRHHTSICSVSGNGDTPPTASPMRPPGSSARPPSAGTLHVPTTSSMYVNSHTPVLLQTAKATVGDAAQQGTTPTMEVRVILDTGSQRSYATTRVQEVLGAEKMYSETMIINTFGAERGERRESVMSYS